MLSVAVSIVIPVYNSEAFLPECLDSVLAQTYPHFEVLCVDDGSTDSSPKILEEYAARDPRIRLFRQANSFAGAARNRGMEHASGKYLLFLDSDDFIDSSLLELAVAKAEEQAADIVVFSGCEYNSLTHAIKDKPTYLKEKVISPFEVFSRKDIPQDILTFTNPAPWNKLYRREFVEAHQLRFMPIRYSNDVYFTKMAFALAERITTVNRSLVYYRVMQGTNTQSVKFGYPLLFLTVLEKIHDDLLSLGIYDEISQSFRDYAVHMLSYELRPYETRADRFDIYRQVFENEMIVSTALLEQEMSTYGSRNEYCYVKGLQASYEFHRKHAGDFSRTFQQLAERRSAEAPVFSVIIPVYNKQAFIGACLESVFAQTFSDYEIVLVDDGSTDGSLETILSCTESHDGIAIFSQANAGPSAARNLGIRHARGRWLLYLDADDRLVPEALQILSENISGQDMLFFNADVFYDSEAARDEKLQKQIDEFIDYYTRHGKYEGPYSGIELFDAFVKNSDYLPCPVFQTIRREFLLGSGHLFCDGIIHEDNLYTFQNILPAPYASYIPDHLYLRRVHPGSIMTNPTGPENVYGYFKCWLEMRKTFFSLQEKPEILHHQSSILQTIRVMLNGTRKKYAELPDEEKGFYFGMCDDEKQFFEAMIADYCGKEKEAGKLKKDVRKQKDEAGKLKKEIEQYKVEEKDLKEKVTALEKKVALLEKEYDKELSKSLRLRHSNAYKIGRFLTWPLRKLKEILKKARN